MQPVRIVIFAKAPIAGFAKTRLIPSLGLEGSADLAARLIKYTVEQALLANLGVVELCVAPDKDLPLWTSLNLPGELHWSEQGEGDLGARLSRAAARGIEAGEAVLLIGTDCPGLNAQVLQASASQLKIKDSCMVPAEDGGYVLLGMNSFDPSLFSSIPWSTSRVAALTRQQISQLGWTLAELPVLPDIDEPEDLRWLPASWKPDYQAE